MHRRAWLLIALTLSAACAWSLWPRQDVDAQDDRGDAPQVRLVDAFPGERFARPVYLTQPPGADQRLFVVEQAGRIVAMSPDGTRSVFLDIEERVTRKHNEEGLLGLAFHPDFDTNGRFFVHYSAQFAKRRERRGVVSEFRTAGDDRATADADSERILFEVPQPYGNHNGGMIEFGPDGMLYISLGDGGAANDPHGHGQNLGSLLGAILRIDVDNRGSKAYAIPNDNPFRKRRGARPEIWAYGLRNVWRFSFDRATGEMWFGDVGQNKFEEVGIVRAGENHGWNEREGLVPFRGGEVDGAVDPLTVYPRQDGVSVTGGYVYRGSRIPELQGAYLYADYGSGRTWALRRRADLRERPTGPGDVEVDVLIRRAGAVASFGEDRAGEVYLCVFPDRVMRLEPGGDADTSTPLPATLSELDLFSDLTAHTPNERAIPYDLRAPFWSDGATKDRFILLPAAAGRPSPMTYRADDAFGLPTGTYVVKTFTLAKPDGTLQRLETRVIKKVADGFEAATYRWRPDMTDADLVDRPLDVVVEGPTGLQTWTFPGPWQCDSCHTDASGYVLGVTARQLTTEDGSDPLLAWAERGLLTGLPAEGVSARPRLEQPSGDGDLDARARAVLDTNCAMCHRPGAPAVTHLDLRAWTPLADTGLLDSTPTHGDLGTEEAGLVVPGKPDRSVLLRRMLQRGAGRMPPLASHVIDRESTDLIEAWIKKLR